MPHPLIEQFVDTLGQVRDHIHNGRTTKAHNQYLRLHSLYEQINQSDLAHHHKKIAYDQITRIHSRLEGMEPRRNTRLAPAIIVLGILFIGAGILISAQPGLVGLAIFDTTVTQSLGLTFETSAQHATVLNGVPTGLKVNGHLTGGTARVWAVQGGERTLLFDSEQATIVDGGFASTCADTCQFDGTERTITLDVELFGGKLYLDNIHYTTDETNTAPRFVGEKHDYDLAGETTIDLAPLFIDDDNDKLVYLVTATDNVQATVRGSTVTFRRDGGSGERHVTLIASDLKDITRVPITLHLS